MITIKYNVSSVSVWTVEVIWDFVQFYLFLWLISSGTFNTARDRDRDQEWDWNQLTMSCCTQLFTLFRDKDRDQDPLFPIAWVLFLVPPPVPVPCSVNKALISLFQDRKWDSIYVRYKCFMLPNLLPVLVLKGRWPPKCAK